MIGDNVEIRPAVPKDALEIARIWLRVLQHSSGVLAPPEKDAIVSFEQKIREPQGKSGMWVAVLDGTVLGWQGLLDFGVTRCVEWHSPVLTSQGDGMRKG